MSAVELRVAVVVVVAALAAVFVAFAQPAAGDSRPWAPARFAAPDASVGPSGGSCRLWAISSGVGTEREVPVQ